MNAVTLPRKSPGVEAGARLKSSLRHSFTDTVKWQERNRQELDAAKARVGISAAWQILGLPGEPHRSCCSPFREDRHPSFSVTDDRLWHDHSTGEGGDVVSFIMRATSAIMNPPTRLSSALPTTKRSFRMVISSSKVTTDPTCIPLLSTSSLVSQPVSIKMLDKLGVSSF